MLRNNGVYQNRLNTNSFRSPAEIVRDGLLLIVSFGLLIAAGMRFPTEPLSANSPRASLSVDGIHSDGELFSLHSLDEQSWQFSESPLGGRRYVGGLLHRKADADGTASEIITESVKSSISETSTIQSIELAVAPHESEFVEVILHGAEPLSQVLRISADTARVLGAFSDGRRILLKELVHGGSNQDDEAPKRFRIGFSDGRAMYSVAGKQVANFPMELGENLEVLLRANSNRALFHFVKVTHGQEG